MRKSNDKTAVDSLYLTDLRSVFGMVTEPKVTELGSGPISRIP